MKKLDPKIIRIGDLVEIVDPRVVIRVGYPKTVKDYLPEAESKYRTQLQQDLDLHPQHSLIERILRDIAYGLAKADGFGGRDRTLHLEVRTNLIGKILKVQELRTVKTGRYYPPYHSGPNYYGEVDYDPGGLENEKTHRLVAVCPNDGFFRTFDTGLLELPITHVRKVNL